MRPPASPKTLEAGLFLIVVALPLTFAPFTAFPFVDAKLVVLMAGAAIIATSRPPSDKGVITSAGILVVALAAATVFSVDPWWSLMGPENRGTGTLTLATSVLLLCAAIGVDEGLRKRVPSWLFWSGVAVAVVAVLGRFVPIGGEGWELGTLSSTIGHRVYVGGFLAAATLAAITIKRPLALYFGVLALGSALSVSAPRAAWLGLTLGLIVALLRDRSRRSTIMRIVATLIVVFTAWLIVDRAIDIEGPIELSAAPRFAQLDEGSAQERPAVFRAYLRAWAHEPLLGSGPGTGWYGFLRYATTDELRVAGRGYADAHNIVLEIGATAGSVGVLALVAFVLVVLERLRGTPADRTWALSAALALAISHLLQPFNLVLTPLMGLLAGLALRSTHARTQIRIGRWVAVLATASFLLASSRMIASSLERYGGHYASERALKLAIAFEPRRMNSSLALAKHLAFDFRSGRRGADEEAKALIQRSVHQHPWHGQVRLVAANVEVLLDDRPAARRWTQEHLRLFPRDPEALAGAAALALQAGELIEARVLATRAMQVDPKHALARTVLTELDRP